MGVTTRIVEAKLEVIVAVHIHHKDVGLRMLEVQCLYLAQEEPLVVMLALHTLKVLNMEVLVLVEVTTEISNTVGNSDRKK